eukprot:CCRYP_004616-RC/>CCRYP_004616-RC protein AED:0.05 eAED:0.05 QI:123/0.62/0.77/1/0.37/0.44/9/2114/748
MISLCIIVFLCRHASFVEPFQSVPTWSPNLIYKYRGQYSYNREKSFFLSSVRKTSIEQTQKPRSRRSRSSRRRSSSLTKDLKHPDAVETWRIYGVDVDPDSLGCSSKKTRSNEKDKAHQDVSPERLYMTTPVLTSLLTRLRIKPNHLVDDSKDDQVELPPELIDTRVIRRSTDARRRKGSDPKYTYVVDVDITKGNARALKFVHQPGRMERVNFESDLKKRNEVDADGLDNRATLPKVLIIGAGPAGLFCALSLASSGFKPIVLERGQPVEARGKSIGALIHRRSIDPESNFCTWSDGKLTTRIGRNSEPVRYVLETLVNYGAPKRILVEGAPHLGTDNLVRLLRNMREDLKLKGGEIHFGCRASKFDIQDGVITSVEAENSDEKVNANAEKNVSFNQLDAVVLATGHSARDVYQELHASGVTLEAKGFAVGFRIEHPQRIINEIQYGKEWGRRVFVSNESEQLGQKFTHRMSTDDANAQHFGKYDTDDKTAHSGNLPVPSYRLATNEAFDGESNRGAYSFCMCPGKLKCQIVPSSTEEGELCINGMSFSNRDSLWANSACVVTVSPDDPILDKYQSTHGQLAGLEFQRDMERKAWTLGGGNFTAPVQRLTDFVAGRVSSSVPSSSYRLGVKSAACHDIYPKPLYNALVNAITQHFEKQMPGFLTHEALIHGVETRTSSPLRVVRDPKSLEALGVHNLYPAGEGAGFAGGIVSAAVDGLAVAEVIKAKFLGEGKSSSQGTPFSVGFDY